MEKEIVLFQEAQRQSSKWVYFLLLIILMIIIFGIVQQLILKKPFGNHPAPDWLLLVLLIIPIGLLGFVRKNKLSTSITKDEITVHYKPYQKQMKTFAFKEMDTCYVRLYSPLKEYGGWGMRTAFNPKHGKAYNMSGNYGIQIEMKNGQKVLIGTQKPAEVKNALKKIDK